MALLMENLAPQLSGELKVYTLEDQRQETTGAKRNELIDRAYADSPDCWVVHLDDDDLTSPTYCWLILGAIKASQPDAIGFWQWRYLDGNHYATALYSKDNRINRQEMVEGQPFFTRKIFHINPVKIALARRVRFRNQTIGEDIDYANRLAPLLKSQVILGSKSEPLYHYFQRSKTNKPKGIK